MIRDFYDIESLSNVFMLANFKEDTNELEFFYKVDNPDILIHTDPFLYRNMKDVTPYVEQLEDSLKKETEANQFERADALFGLVPQATRDTEFARLVDKVVHEVNLNFTGTVVLYDLDEDESVIHMAETFGLSDAKYTNNVSNPSHYDGRYRLICDTDKNYDPDVHPFFCGYNSYQYDTTMLAIFFYEAFGINANGIVTIKCPDAALMRCYNDELFTDEFRSRMFTRLYYTYESLTPKKLSTARNFSDPKALIRKNMMMSGRHIDVARLNEKMTHVPLKRLLGMLGYQIKESDKLATGQDTINNLEELLELFGYNASDVINLQKLADHKLYRSGFDNKKALINSYPEVVYQKKKDEYKPDETAAKIRSDRSVTDSTSATLTTNILCPYNHLSDYDTVSFMYPSENQSKKTGIPRVNVLEEAKKFFYAHFPQPELRAKFDTVYDYYKSIEGKNFNDGKNYFLDHGLDPMFDILPPHLEAHKLDAIPAPNLYMVYYNADGTPSSYYVNFSTGGIHGAEYNKKLYDADVKRYEEEVLPVWQEKVDLFAKVAQIYPNPWDLKVNKGIEIDGVKYKPSDFLKPKPTVTTAAYKPVPPKPERPQLFVEKDGKWSLNKRYAFTSAGLSNHEDFESYYPNLLRMMDAFFNTGLNYDRYGEVFELKSRYGKYMKDESRPQDEREYYSNLRNGVKLILNSASGAGDKDEDSNIRMNNKIISMRIIGQLFTWRIGQAQVFAGAGMPSTNTDGLYSIMEATQNNKILADESADIHVKIEPELLYLISKDSNNRLEIDVHIDPDTGAITLGEVTGASGGSLSCREGPRPDKSLDHPAILDWALTEYLIYASLDYKGTSLSSPFNETVGRAILKAAPNYKSKSAKFDTKAKLLLMYQNIVASSPSNYRYTFATDPVTGNKIPLQHYNRVFIMKDGTPNSYYLRYAEAKTIPKTNLTKRKQNGLRIQQHDPEALEMLEAQGINTMMIPSDREATITKLKLIEANWQMYICNKDLYMMSDEELQWILDNLDYDKYLELLKGIFEKNWFNEMPSEQKTPADNSSDLDKMFEENEQESAEPVSDENSGAVTEDTASAAVPAETTAVLEESDSAPEELPATNPLDEIADTIAIMNKMSVTLKRTIVYKTDIEKAETLMGKYVIPNIDPHSILAKVVQILTDTDIDA